MLRALIFDFDGTILDTETAEFRRWQELYRSNGMELDLRQWQQGIGTWGGFDPWASLPDEARARRSQLEEELRQNVVADIGGLDVRPGIRRVIEEARERQFLLAVASSSGREWVEEWLRRHDLLRFFPVLSTRDDVARVKPNPELYSLAVQRLGVRPEEGLAIEDSLNGATAAVAAGLAVVVVPNEITASQPFDPDWPRLEGFDGGLERLLDAAAGSNGR